MSFSICMRKHACAISLSIDVSSSQLGCTKDWLRYLWSMCNKKFSDSMFNMCCTTDLYVWNWFYIFFFLNEQLMLNIIKMPLIKYTECAFIFFFLIQLSF